jgi:uncharacterized membrane protein
MSPSRSGRVAVAVLSAAACAVVIAVAAGPARFVAGALLALCLPGLLAADALARGAGPDARPDRVLGATLVVPLSIAATAIAGLVAAATGWGFRPGPVAALLAAECVALGVVAAWPRRAAPLAAPAAPATTEPATRRGRPDLRAVVAAAPVAALTAVLAVAVVATARHRTADSYYTEFAVEPSGSGRGEAWPQVFVVVHSRERAPTRFRIDIRVDGVVNRSVAFTLRPGERQVVPVHSGSTVDSGPAGGAEARLYRADETAPYRRLTLSR